MAPRRRAAPKRGAAQVEPGPEEQAAAAGPSAATQLGPRRSKRVKGREEEAAALGLSPPLPGSGAEHPEAVETEAEGEEGGSEEEGNNEAEEEQTEPEPEPAVDEFWAEAEVPGPNPETVAFRTAAHKAAVTLIRGSPGRSSPCQPERVHPEPAKKLAALISGAYATVGRSGERRVYHPSFCRDEGCCIVGWGQGFAEFLISAGADLVELGYFTGYPSMLGPAAEALGLRGTLHREMARRAARREWGAPSAETVAFRAAARQATRYLARGGELYDAFERWQGTSDDECYQGTPSDEGGSSDSAGGVESRGDEAGGGKAEERAKGQGSADAAGGSRVVAEGGAAGEEGGSGYLSDMSANAPASKENGSIEDAPNKMAYLIAGAEVRGSSRGGEPLIYHPLFDARKGHRMEGWTAAFVEMLSLVGVKFISGTLPPELILDDAVADEAAACEAARVLVEGGAITAAEADILEGLIARVESLAWGRSAGGGCTIFSERSNSWDSGGPGAGIMFTQALHRVTAASGGLGSRWWKELRGVVGQAGRLVGVKDLPAVIKARGKAMESMALRPWGVTVPSFD